jgi:hypothetical protein
VDVWNGYQISVIRYQEAFAFAVWLVRSWGTPKAQSPRFSGQAGATVPREVGGREILRLRADKRRRLSAQDDSFV